MKKLILLLAAGLLAAIGTTASENSEIDLLTITEKGRLENMLFTDPQHGDLRLNTYHYTLDIFSHTINCYKYVHGEFDGKETYTVVSTGRKRLEYLEYQYPHNIEIDERGRIVKQDPVSSTLIQWFVEGNS